MNYEINLSKDDKKISSFYTEKKTNKPDNGKKDKCEKEKIWIKN